MSKVRVAQHFNCSGLLIYSDPQDYAPKGVPVYPDGPSLPPGGIQRGTLKIIPGDPLTPDVPAIGKCVCQQALVAQLVSAFGC